MYASLDAARPLARLPAFVLLVFALSISFWLIGGRTDQQFMPGRPDSKLAAFCPMAAALVLIYRNGGLVGARVLLMRSFDVKWIHAKRWLVPILLRGPQSALWDTDWYAGRTYQCPNQSCA